MLIRIRFLLLTLVLGAALVGLAACGDDDDEGDGEEPTAAATEPAAATDEPSSTQPATTPGDGASSLSLTSSAFADGEAMPVEHTCNGANTSPPLTITGVPEGAVTLALTVVDIDGPGGEFVHWTAWNIEPTVTEVPAGTVPDGAVEGQTGLGTPGYFGPCPPSGTHRYVFTVYALDAALELDAEASGLAELEAAMEGHILGSVDLTGTYAA
jgi:Raf kinase inhibitor-like YbhB/YbcL family protein